MPRERCTVAVVSAQARADGLERTKKNQVEGKRVASAVYICHIPLLIRASDLMNDLVALLNLRRLPFSYNALANKINLGNWKENVNNSHCSITIELLNPVVFQFGVSDQSPGRKYYCIVPGIARKQQALYTCQPCSPEITGEVKNMRIGAEHVFNIKGILNNEGTANAIMRAVKSYLYEKRKSVNVPNPEIIADVQSIYVKNTLHHELQLCILLRKSSQSKNQKTALRKSVLQDGEPHKQPVILNICGWKLWICEAKGKNDPEEVVNNEYMTTVVTQVLPRMTIEQIVKVLQVEQSSVVGKIEDIFLHWKSFFFQELYVIWNEAPEAINGSVIGQICSTSANMMPKQTTDKWLPGQWMLSKKLELQCKIVTVTAPTIKSYANAVNKNDDEKLQLVNKVKEAETKCENIRIELAAMVNAMKEEKLLLEARLVAIESIEARVNVQISTQVRKEVNDQVSKVSGEVSLIKTEVEKYKVSSSEILQLIKRLEESRKNDAVLVEKLVMGFGLEGSANL